MNPTSQTTITDIRYEVPSATTKGTSYVVRVDPRDGRMTCTCPARRQCWHQKAVIAGAAGKPRVRVTQRPLVRRARTSPEGQAFATNLDV